MWNISFDRRPGEIPMKTVTLTIFGAMLLSLLLISTSVLANEQKIEKTDPEDVGHIYDPMREKDNVAFDNDLLFASIDWSGSIVKCQFKLKGDVIVEYDDNVTNTYFFNIDIKTENNEEDIFFVYSKTGLSGFSTETSVIAFENGNYSIDGGTFNFEFDKMHFGTYSDVLDIEVHVVNSDGWIDAIDWGDVKDDDTDDDAVDGNTTSEDEDSPSPGVLLAVISMCMVLVVFGRKKKNDL